MIFGAILGGGIGKRMGSTQTPKQFLPLGSKPIIVHTIEKFIAVGRFTQVYIGVPSDWLMYVQDLKGKYLPESPPLSFVEGGSDRNETLMKIIKKIEEQYSIIDEDIIVTHDAVRPFVSRRIIDDNIEAALNWGACDTVIAATDTIVESGDGCFVSSIPERKYMYQGQTPQSFRIALVKNCYENLYDEQKKQLTDACKIVALNGKRVSMVEGDIENIKITTQYDYKIAQMLINEEKR